MLQQTTVGTVINRFEKFIKRFPNFDSLASSSENDLLMAWKGLGYYRRAKNLRLAAIYIRESYQGNLPKNYEKIKLIPGVGEYTASALLGIGFNQSFLAIDANLERVLSRVYQLNSFQGKDLKLEIKSLFETRKILALKNFSGREVNESLMDLGREVCQANKVQCDKCLIRNYCQAYKSKTIFNYPKKFKKHKKKYDLDLVRFVVRKKNKILGYRKDEQSWLSGQLELPTYILNTNDKNLKQYPRWIGSKFSKDTKLKIIPSLITKYKIKNFVLEIDYNDFNIIKGDSFSKHFKFYNLGLVKNEFSSISLKIFKDL